MFTLDYAINFSIGLLIGLTALVLINLLILFIRVRWFNIPTFTQRERITNSLDWCIFWSKWVLVNMITFSILYVIKVN